MKAASIVLAIALLSCALAEETFTLTYNGKKYGPYTFKQGEIISIGGIECKLNIVEERVMWGLATVKKRIDERTVLAKRPQSPQLIVIELPDEIANIGEDCWYNIEPNGLYEYREVNGSMTLYRKYKGKAEQPHRKGPNF